MAQNYLLYLLSAVLASTTAQPVAIEPSCSSPPPTDALYRIIAHECPGPSSTRLSTGFRVASVIYTTLHGVLGCRGEILAYPQCPQPGYKEIILDRHSSAPKWDLVKLESRSGKLRGASLAIKTTAPEKDEEFQVCGYPNWNTQLATCSNYLTFQPGEMNTLQNLLDSGDDLDTRNALQKYGIPALLHRVLRYETPSAGGDGFSGGPLVNRKGEVIAVHDGRYNSRGILRHWAIPLFEQVIWDDWKNIKSGVNSIGREKPPAALHFAEPISIKDAPPPPAQVQQFLEYFIGSVLASYACDWMRTGTELLNNACSAGIARCQELGIDATSKQVCGTNCVKEIYNKSFGQLKPFASFLCQHFAVAASSTPESLGCAKPEEYTWYTEHMNDTYQDIFMDGNMQFNFMRELYFASVPNERRAEILSTRLDTWAKDAYTRKGYWLIDDAKVQFQKWHSEHRSPTIIYDSSGVQFFINPSMDWAQFAPELFLFLISYFSENNVPLGMPVCHNARMELNSEGDWQYLPDGPCSPDIANCLWFWLNSEGSTIRNARRIAAALSVGALITSNVALERLPPSDATDSSSLLNFRVKAHWKWQSTESNTLTNLRVEIKRLKCDGESTADSGQQLRSCVLDRLEPGASWNCDIDVVLNESCPSIEVRLSIDSALARRYFLTLPGS